MILYRDIKFHPPFPATVNSISNHITYLDTKGRPAITLKYEQLTDKHTGLIYVRTITLLVLLRSR